ncbi:MAG: OmpA family protein [Myxococcota bacterium]|nr:OmpA family protein [Myxococcota bacterium]
MLTFCSPPCRRKDALPLLLVCAAALSAGPAGAAPVLIRADQAVARPRRDPGQGLCGTAIHLRDTGGVAFSTVEDAARLLNQPKGAGLIQDKISRLFRVINLRNADVGSGGDFSGPGTDEAYFPFSDDVLAVPRGNNRNFALRLRGYLSVLRAGTVTLAAHADDAHRLLIAGTRITESDERISARVTRQVHFEAAGLYPLEVLYFQNGSVAILEVSQAEGEQAEGSPSFIDTAVFRLLPQSRLYTARSGLASCTECEAGSCPAESFCVDGLCQPCVTSEHCGPGCNACPDRTPVCQAGRCVECATDHHCPPGKICDAARGLCVGGTPCRSNADCPPGRVCDPESGVCVLPPEPCATDADCPAELACDTRRGVCAAPPAPCRMDSDCPWSQLCDAELRQCRWPPRGRYVGGTGGCSAAGGAAGGSGAALGLLLVLGVLWRRAHAVRWAAGAAVVFFCAPSGRAQAQISVNAQTFRPAIGPRNLVTLEGTNTPQRLRPMAGAVLEFAYRPLRLIDPETGETLADTVGHMTTLHLLGGLGLTDWLSLGAALPVVLYQAFDSRTPPSDVPSPPGAFGVGDLRVVSKIRILNNTMGGLGLAIVPQILFPVGKGVDLRGEDAFGIEPRAALDYRFRGGAFVAANLGFLLRTSDQVVREMLVTHQIRYGVGGYIPILKGFSAGAELVGSTSLARRERGAVYSPLEAYLFGRWQHRSGLQVDAGGGWGFTDAVGSPQFRLLAAVAYVPFASPQRPQRNEDPDRDGVIGAADRCPTEPGPAERHGCPDRDTDGDGTVDRLDACPTEPGPADNRGCPEPDVDRDGIPDRLDKCPYDPGPQPDGCPARKYIAVTEGRIELKQRIYFATNKSAVARQSYPLLDEIADVLRKRPTMEILVEGHTDSRGGLAYNMRLSEARARAVRDYLVRAGVDPGRVTAKGYGPTRPVADNTTAAGREKNRRTEFVVIKQ